MRRVVHALLAGFVLAQPALAATIDPTPPAPPAARGLVLAAIAIQTGLPGLAWPVLFGGGFTPGNGELQPADPATFDVWQAKTAAGPHDLQDSAGNLEARFTDAGTTGGLYLTSSFGLGASSLSAPFSQTFNVSAAGLITTPHITTTAVAADPTTLAGQLSISHLTNGGGAPTSPTAGSGCGTSSAPNNAGGDAFGNLGVTCGTAGTGGQAYITINFKNAYSTAPYCVISPANANTASQSGASPVSSTSSTTQLSVIANTAATAMTGALLWNYACGQ